jgi:hypothetical protein
MTRAAPLLALTLLVAGCGEQADAPAEQGGAASGEVLEGSVSDAMIPLDQLKSEAPLAPRQAQGDITGDLDSEQPVVTPAPGFEPGAGGAAAEPAAPAAPAPEAAPAR